MCPQVCNRISSPLVRALVLRNKIIVNHEHRYLLPLPYDIRSLPLRAQEEFTELVAEQINKMFGISSTYFSVLNGGYNDVPFYVGETLWEEQYYNISRT